MQKPRVLDLFSGIGGFSLGLERAGMRTVAFCEIEPYCRAVLAKHWPNVPIHDDIKTINIGRAEADLVCGGPPCQPASRAGQQRGEKDDRWLWPQAIRVVSAVRPKWICFENPLGLYDVGIESILSALEMLGYSNTDQGKIEPFEIPACAVGAWHRRDRIWIVAHDGRERFQGPRNVSHSSSIEESGQSLLTHDGIGEQWRAEPDVVRVVHGVSRRVDRLRALGNAVVPQVVEAIGRAIIMAEAEHEPRRA